jgi:aspartate/methionine/tyrosine aminotransferase
MSGDVPGIDPPQSLLDGLSKVSKLPLACGYCLAAGELSLRSALTGEMKEVYGQDADISVDDIVLTAGSNMAFVTAIMSLADTSDEIILLVPW